MSQLLPYEQGIRPFSISKRGGVKSQARYDSFNERTPSTWGFTNRIVLTLNVVVLEIGGL